MTISLEHYFIDKLINFNEQTINLTIKPLLYDIIKKINDASIATLNDSFYKNIISSKFKKELSLQNDNEAKYFIKKYLEYLGLIDPDDDSKIMLFREMTEYQEYLIEVITKHRIDPQKLYQIFTNQVTTNLSINYSHNGLIDLFHRRFNINKEDSRSLLKLLLVLGILEMNERKYQMNSFFLNKLRDILEHEQSNWICWDKKRVQSLFSIEEAEKNDYDFQKLHVPMKFKYIKNPNSKDHLIWTEKELLNYLNDPSYDLDKPRVIAIVGAQGSGKSELIRYVSLELPKVSPYHDKEFLIYIHRRYMNPQGLIKKLLDYLTNLDPSIAKKYQGATFSLSDVEFSEWDLPSVFKEVLNECINSSTHPHLINYYKKIRKKPSNLNKAKSDLFQLWNEYYNDFIIKGRSISPPEVINESILDKILSGSNLSIQDPQEKLALLNEFNHAIHTVFQVKYSNLNFTPQTILEEIEKISNKFNKRMLVLFEDLTVAGGQSAPLLNWFISRGLLRNWDIIIGYTFDFERNVIGNRENIFDRYDKRFEITHDTSEFPLFLKDEEDQIEFVKTYLSYLKHDHSPSCLCKKQDDPFLYPFNRQFIINLFQSVSIKTPRQILRRLSEILLSQLIPSTRVSLGLIPKHNLVIDKMTFIQGNYKNELEAEFKNMKQALEWYGTINLETREVKVNKTLMDTFHLPFSKIPKVVVEEKNYIFDSPFFTDITTNFLLSSIPQSFDDNDLSTTSIVSSTQETLNNISNNLTAFINQNQSLNTDTKKYLFYGLQELFKVLNLFPGVFITPIYTEQGMNLVYQDTFQNEFPFELQTAEIRNKRNKLYSHIKEELKGNHSYFLLRIGFYRSLSKKAKGKRKTKEIQAKIQQELKALINNPLYYSNSMSLALKIQYDGNKLFTRYLTSIISKDLTKRQFLKILIKIFLFIRLLGYSLAHPNIRFNEFYYALSTKYNHNDVTYEGRLLYDLFLSHFSDNTQNEIKPIIRQVLEKEKLLSSSEALNNALSDEQKREAIQNYFINLYCSITEFFLSFSLASNKIINKNLSSILNYYFQDHTSNFNDFVSNLFNELEQDIQYFSQGLSNKTITSYLEKTFLVSNSLIIANPYHLFKNDRISLYNALSYITYMYNIIPSSKLTKESIQEIIKYKVYLPKNETEILDLIEGIRDILITGEKDEIILTNKKMLQEIIQFLKSSEKEALYNISNIINVFSQNTTTVPIRKFYIQYLNYSKVFSKYRKYIDLLLTIEHDTQASSSTMFELEIHDELKQFKWVLTQLDSQLSQINNMLNQI